MKKILMAGAMGALMLSGVSRAEIRESMQSDEKSMQGDRLTGPGAAQIISHRQIAGAQRQLSDSHKDMKEINKGTKEHYEEMLQAFQKLDSDLKKIKTFIDKVSNEDAKQALESVLEFLVTRNEIDKDHMQQLAKHHKMIEEAHKDQQGLHKKVADSHAALRAYHKKQGIAAGTVTVNEANKKPAKKASKKAAKSPRKAASVN